MAGGVAPQGLPPLAGNVRADLVEGEVPADRLPGLLLLFGAEVAERRPQEPRRGRSQAAGDLCEAGDSAQRAEAAGRRRGDRKSTRELHSLMRSSNAVFCLQNKHNSIYTQY